jgi:hypothetical protein
MKWPANILRMGWRGNGVNAEGGIGVVYDGVRLSGECNRLKVRPAPCGHSPSVSTLSVHSLKVRWTKRERRCPASRAGGEAWYCFRCQWKKGQTACVP